MAVAVPALHSLQIGLPTCYTPAEIPVLQHLFDDVSFTFPHLVEFDVTCDENSIAFASFLLRHPNITSLGVAIGRSENVQVFPPHQLSQLLPNLQRFRGSIPLCYHFVQSNTSRPINSLSLRTTTFQRDHFLKLVHVLRCIPTVVDLFIETNNGLTLGHLRGIISERPNLQRFSCKVKSGDPDDEFSIVAAAYGIVLNNLPQLREFGAKFADSNNDLFRLLQKQAIRSALRVDSSSQSSPLTIKVYAAACLLPAVIYRGNRFC
ncbi:hypothetical protein F5877DRAFT_78960 [Lentinula edodes]|nr:hypothetical protein F5877DRAFT_78960 [Lentinula edodes]